MLPKCYGDAPALETANQRLGWLKSGNRPGRFSDAPRCGAKCRRTGLPCRAPACHGKRRCRLHGGKSTGPRTAAGLERSKRARWKHGRYSLETQELRRQERARCAAINAAIRANGHRPITQSARQMLFG